MLNSDANEKCRSLFFLTKHWGRSIHAPPKPHLIEAWQNLWSDRLPWHFCYGTPQFFNQTEITFVWPNTDVRARSNPTEPGFQLENRFSGTEALYDGISHFSRSCSFNHSSSGKIVVHIKDNLTLLEQSAPHHKLSKWNRRRYFKSRMSGVTVNLLN